MNFKEVLKVAEKNILSNKSRSLLTMLGVIIGVAAVIVMMSVSAGTEATISEAINGLGSNLLFINSAMTRGGHIVIDQSSLAAAARATHTWATTCHGAINKE